MIVGGFPAGVAGAFLLLVLPTVSLAQNPAADPPSVIVVSQKWRLEIRNPRIEEDPFKSVNEQQELENRRKEVERQNEALRERGMPTINPPVPVLDTNERSPRITSTYIYELKVRNGGRVGIRKIVWEYVFYDLNTKEEVGRRRFESQVNIAPRRTGNATARSALPPTGTIDASRAGKKDRDEYKEAIVILGVEYADSTRWP